MTTAHWFTDYDRNGFPVEKAVFGGCDLSVAFIDGEWQWLVKWQGRESPKGPHGVIGRRARTPKPPPGVF